MAVNPGAQVVTVTAGRPGPHELTEWDRRCGFGQDDDVVGARRREDEAALRRLGATPRWLDFLDRQYADGEAPDPGRVADALRQIVRDADVVASPLGLTHPDHIAVAAACRMLARPGWILYEDAIYRADDGRTEAAIAALRNDGFVPEPIQVPPAQAKRAAVDAYRSQVLGLGTLVEDAFRPERYWELRIG